VGAGNGADVALDTISAEVRRVRAECPTISAGEAERLVAVCRGDHLDPELWEIVQRSAAVLKQNLGILGKRRELEINVIDQDLSANSEVLDVSSKRRKVHDDAEIGSRKGDDVLLSINLTGPHGEARQEQ
jgi:hypothetical protein